MPSSLRKDHSVENSYLEPRDREGPWLLRWLPVWSFVLCCTLFVPVLFWFGLVAFVVPVGWGILSIFRELSNASPVVILILGVYLAVYLIFFIGLGLLIDRLVAIVPLKSVRLILHLAVLAGVFQCSFLRVLTYTSIRGSGWTYTFWTALERLREKQRTESW